MSTKSASRFTPASKQVRDTLLATPTLLWLLALVVAPMVLVVAYSFGQRHHIDLVVFDNGLTASNYKDALSSDLLPILIRTVAYAVIATVGCVALGLPLAYWISRYSGRNKTFWVGLVVVPFLTSYLVRIYAWRLILASNGPLSSALSGIGLGSEHAFLNTHAAVIVGLIYGYLPFMVLPLYVSLERMDWRLVEASSDLGASPSETLRLVTLPSIKSGVIAGTILVLIPALGDFVTAKILGGTKTQVLGSVIQDKFGASGNWPLGSALSVLLLVGVLAAVAIASRNSSESVI